MGQPGDVYEKEADAVADKVVQRMAEPAPVKRLTEPGGVQRKTEPGAVLPGIVQQTAEVGVVQRVASSVVVQAQSAAPAVQEKCAHCEQEEKKEEEEKPDTPKEKLRKKPIFESNAEPPEEDGVLRRKCPACMEDEQVQTKGSDGAPAAVSPGIESSLNASKGKGSPMPDGTRERMEASFGRDLSKVRIHDNPAAAAMSKGLNAQAFTHGNDIYFNSGKYDPVSRPGQHLLAHELTHTLQQGRGGAVRAYPQAGESLPVTEKQQEYYEYRNEVVELKGEEFFDPSQGLGSYISSYWETNPNAPVNVQFGNLASGFIFVNPHTEDYTTTGFIIIPVDGVPIPIPYDEAPDQEDYDAAPQAIPFQHPDLDIAGKDGTPVLIVKIDQGVIWGRLGWVEGKTADQIDPVNGALEAGDTPDDFVKMIFGEEHAGKKFTPSGFLGYYNSLGHGSLDFLMSGDLEVDHQQVIDAAFLIKDGSSKWDGALKTDIQGAEPYDLPLKRTAQGYLSASTNELKLSKKWTANDSGSSASASIDISYASGNLSITGVVDFKSLRAWGKATLSLTDPETAEQLFLQHVPARKAETPEQDDYLDTALPAPDKRLALVAWGELHIVIIDKIYRLEGDVSFAISPEGYIVTTGQVRFKQRYMLMEYIDDAWKWPAFKFHETVLVWGVPVTGTLKGQFSAGYRIGAIWFAELIASGAYSTHPSYLSEFCLSGTIDMPAVLWGRLRAEINVGIGIADYKIFQVGYAINGDAWLKAYVRATPSIGMVKEKGKSPDYCIGGKLYVGGQLKMGLTGNFEFHLIHLSDEDKDGNKEEHEVGEEGLYDKVWTIGDFGAEMKVDYTLGSGEKPNFDYSGKPFDEQAFLEAIAANKKHEEEAKKLKGGFKEGVEGEKKGKEEGTVSSKPPKPMHPDDEPLGTHAVTDSFSMNNQGHLLILTVTGTANKPEVKLEMQSTRTELMDRVEEEMSMYRILLTRVNLTEKQERQCEQAIADLEAIKGEANRIYHAAHDIEANIAQTDLDHLGDMITNYARRFGRFDLGNAGGPPPQTPGPTPTPIPATPSTTPASGPKVPPPGVDVILNLPAQKSIHLKLYQDYVRRRQLEHSLNRPERDTEQVVQWTDNLSQRMRSEVKCKGLALGLFRTGQPDPARDILRPYWSPRRVFGRNAAGDQMRMTVDHIIEYQLRSLTGGEWVDGPWNFELLEPATNSSAGSTLKNNIINERGRLAQITGDPSWTSDDIQFTRVAAPSPDRSAERYLEGDIEDGKQLKDYKKLTANVEDKDIYNDCMDRGGEPF